MGWLAYKYALAPVHFVMERTMLLGIKQRAEGTQPTCRPAPGMGLVGGLTCNGCESGEATGRMRWCGAACTREPVLLCSFPKRPVDQERGEVIMAHLLSLDEEECWRRLSLRAVGRVGFDLGRGPRIHPVNYRVDQTTVVLRTSQNSELARFIQLFSVGSLVAFEVDEIDFGWEQGWSVLVGGRIESVDSPDERGQLHAGWPRPWAGGERNVFARISASEITGREIDVR